MLYKQMQCWECVCVCDKSVNRCCCCYCHCNYVLFVGIREALLKLQFIYALIQRKRYSDSNAFQFGEFRQAPRGEAVALVPDKACKVCDISTKYVRSTALRWDTHRWHRMVKFCQCAVEAPISMQRIIEIHSLWLFWPHELL